MEKTVARPKTHSLPKDTKSILFLSLCDWKQDSALYKKASGNAKKVFLPTKNFATTKHCRFNLNCPYNFGHLKTRTKTPIT